MENKNEQQVPEIMPEQIGEPKKSKKAGWRKAWSAVLQGRFSLDLSH